MDLSVIVNSLGVVSSLAVIAGAIFVVFQLRHSAREIKSNISVSLLEKLTDESFPRRRKMMHDVIQKYSAKNWEGFDDTYEDYEERNFAYQYELMGQFDRGGLVNKKTVMNALQGLVVLDWKGFEPLDKHISERYKSTTSPWRNFRWLAEEARKYMQESGLSF